MGVRHLVLVSFAATLTACNAGPRVVIREEDEQPKSAAQSTAWEYRAEGNTTWACVRSIDNAAELCFRREQNHLDSYLHLPREGNPFFCQHGRCATKINVDGTERTVQGTDDEGGGTRILFLPDAQKLLSEVQHAKEIRLNPPMFGVDQQFVFEVSGLKW